MFGVLTTVNKAYITQQNTNNMKNSFKLAFLGLAIVVSAAACSGNKATTGSDSTATDSSAVAPADTTKADTTAAPADTTKKDSVK